MPILTLSKKKELVNNFIAYDYNHMLDDPSIFGVIYKITNSIDGKSYIGKTSRFYERMTEHVRGASDPKYDKGSCYRLYQSMRSEGIENFYAEIIYIAYNEDDLLEMEIRFIVLYNSLLPEYGYNMSVDRLKYSKQKKSSDKRSKSHMNKRHPIKFLKSNSDPIAAVNLHTQKFIICDGCTLFGRYFFKDKNKAQFSHSILLNHTCHGWYLLSLDDRRVQNHINNLKEKLMKCKKEILREKLINFKMLYEMIANKDVETIEREFDIYSLEYTNASDEFELKQLSSRVNES